MGGAQSEIGRYETIRYHEEFYSRHRLNEPGTWLSRPSPFVLQAIAAAQPRTPTPAAARRTPRLVVDLGSGVGRHTIPAAQTFPPGSLVLGVDLLPIAARQLRLNAREAGVEHVVQPIVADLESFAISGDKADLVIACSAIEHVSCAETFERALIEWQRMTRPGGLHCLVIAVDRVEIDQDGRTRPAAIEFPLTRAQADEVLARCYASWDRLEYSVGRYRVGEERDGTPYRLEAGCIRLLTRRP